MFLTDRERDVKVQWEELMSNKEAELQAVQRTTEELKCEVSSVNAQLEV